MNARKLMYLLLALSVSALFAVGCGKKDEGGGGDKKDPAGDKATTGGGGGAPAAKPAMSAAKAQVEANKIFTARCVTCHGESGKGDGPGAAGLPVKPRDYTDPKWQEETDDDLIKKAIVEGGPAVGKNALMVANKDLGTPEMAPVLDAIVKKIRSFGGK